MSNDRSCATDQELELRDELARRDVVVSHSLYKLEQELLELIEFRDCAETEEEKAAIDAQIQAYIELEVRKVDGIMSFLRHFRVMKENAFAEVERVAEIGRYWAKKEERLTRATLQAMTAHGLRKVQGNLGSFAVHKNAPSVEVTDESLLPNELKRVTVTMSATWWPRFEALLREYGLKEAVASVAPNKTDISAALKRVEPCDVCKGSKVVGSNPGIPCQECNGTGWVKARVAGARLITDKVHLVVK